MSIDRADGFPAGRTIASIGPKQTVRTEGGTVKGEGAVGDKAAREAPGAAGGGGAGVARRNAILALGLAALVLAAFAPSLSNGFINWDDDVYVTANPTIKSVSWENLRTIFGSSYTGVYIPLAIVSYSIEYRLFKLNPAGYHADNLALHVLNCLLVFWLFLLLTGSRPVSFLTALLFALHPLRVESVAWVTERKDVLYGFFFLVSLVMYLLYAKGRSRKFYWLSLAAFLLAAFSKPIAVTLPFVLVLVDYFRARKIDGASIFEKVPFFAVSAAFMAAEFMIGGSLKAPGVAEASGILHRLALACFTAVFYFWKTLVPTKLAMLYPYTDRAAGLLPPWFRFSPLFLLAAGALVAVSLKYTRKVLFGVLFSLAALAPVLQLVPVPGDAIVADRHTYMMGVGAAYLAAAGLVWAGTARRRRPLAVAAAAVIVSLLLVLTFQRCKVWKDSIAAWSDVLRNYKVVAPIAYLNRANAYTEKKEFAQAIADLKTATRLNPAYLEAYNDLGIAYSQTGDQDQAIRQYDRAVAIDPNFSEAYYNRAMSYISERDFERATADLSKVIALDPSNLRASRHRANVRAILGDYAGAIEDYSRVIAEAPGEATAYNDRAGVFAALGEYDRALADYDAAIRSWPGPGIYADAYRGRLAVYYKVKDYDSAWQDVAALMRARVQIAPAFLDELKKASRRKE